MTRWLEAARRTNRGGTELTQPTEPRPAPNGPKHGTGDIGVSSVVSVLSEGTGAEPASRSDAPARPRTPDADGQAFPHGMTPEGRPKTWTGRIVSLEDWRTLSEWERHGSNGRMWNGVTRSWEP